MRERGGGLLMMAGERFAPTAYKDSPLKDVLPIDVIDDKPDDSGEIAESYRPTLTPMGRMHPIFRFSPDERENDNIWVKLKEMYWYAGRGKDDTVPAGYQIKRAAEVLAVQPKKARRGKERERDIKGHPELSHPLVVQQFVGAGRCMFFGFDETWRWNFREDQVHFNQFWIQTVRYLARSRLGRIELRLDRQTRTGAASRSR